MNREHYISKRGNPVCNCPAYPFPHALDSKACRELYDSGSDATYENYKAEIVRDFDRTEARAINGSR